MKPTRHIVKPSGFWKPARSVWFKKNEDFETNVNKGMTEEDAYLEELRNRAHMSKKEWSQTNDLERNLEPLREEMREVEDIGHPAKNQRMRQIKNEMAQVRKQFRMDGWKT